MTLSGAPAERRRVAGGLAGAVVALVLALAPASARPVLAAADPLRTQAAATYTLDPAAGRVHVEIDVTETSLKPNSAQFEYFYLTFGFALQPEATSVRVSGGSADRVTTRRHEGYTEAVVSIGKALSFRQSTSFTIRYDLLGGKPRSASRTRVGAAYSTFGVWAWGDPGYSAVEVHTPAGFDARFNGDAMQVTSPPMAGQILRATPSNPAKFSTIVTAEDDDAYTQTRMSLAGGVAIVVQSWPEDAEWKASVTDTLRAAMPELRTRIGLEWPVADDLDVRERYTPDLEGYSGVFLTDEQRIELSEDLDPVVIVHEASHAWFNGALFLERWIYEGLAEEYAWEALVAVGADDGGGAERPDPKDAGFVNLSGWTHPGVIKDQETDDRERFGYQASFWVVHAIAEAAGVEQMREAFARADASTTAYPGAGDPETVLSGDTWRRLLDLTEPLGRPDPAAVDAAVRAYVLGPADEDELDARHAARNAYRSLLAAGGDWLPGWYVRGPMGTWDFDVATARMAEATAVVDLRDRVATAAGALALAPGPALRAAYEGAKDDLAAATALAEDQLRALDAIAAARTKVDRAPDLVSQVGLLGADPVAPYEQARAAFTSDLTADAIGQANAASSMIDGAAEIGRQRLVVGAVATLGGLALVVLLRRRSRRRRAATSAPGAAELPRSADVFATGPAATQPYATLAADPASEPPPSSAGPPDDEGGQAPG